MLTSESQLESRATFQIGSAGAPVALVFDPTPKKMTLVLPKSVARDVLMSFDNENIDLTDILTLYKPKNTLQCKVKINKHSRFHPATLDDGKADPASPTKFDQLHFGDKIKVILYAKWYKPFKDADGKDIAGGVSLYVAAAQFVSHHLSINVDTEEDEDMAFETLSFH